MPILRRESELFPDDLFARDDGSERWQVAHVRSRQEKVLARFLCDRRIHFYLPQIERRIRRSGREFVSFLPLFPGYVFTRSALRSAEIWRSNVVAGLIDVADQERLTTELRQIRSLQESGAALTPAPPELVPGDAVRISDGVFQDYVGTVIRASGSLRLLVSVSVINKTVAVEFPRGVLEPVRSGGRRTRRA